ncbi:MAG: DUF6064 family protein [Wenzhouxiangellaceae bacterium]|nr:DUF6064 family protein [Wenzhouxiangellaceae bacterium]
MSDWTSYAVADFIPFTAEVYFRLIKRVSETWWPLHLLTLAAGLVAAGLAWAGRVHSAVFVPAAALAWVGATFLIGQYAQLNWAGPWFGGAFVVAGVLLLLLAFGQPRSAVPLRRNPVPGLAGLSRAVLGLPGYPLIATLVGFGWSQAEAFGIHPDPTAVAAPGLALLMLRGYRLWLAAAVPILWCLVSALTLQVLQAPWAGLLYAAVGVALIGMVWSRFVEADAPEAP